MGGGGGGALGAVAGAAFPLYGMYQAGQSAQSAAEQQQAMAQAGLTQQQQARQQAIGFATQDFGQMAAIQNQFAMSKSLLDNQIGNLQQQQALFQQVGSQASELMSGKSAASLAPLQAQQDRAKQQLENHLRDQLGSGFAATSAGQEALARFNQQSQETMVGAQQQAIGQYLGYGAQYGSQINQGYNQTYSTAANINQQGIQGAAQQQALRIGAAGQPVNYNNAISTAGANQTADIYMGSAMQKVYGAAAGYATGSKGG